MRRATPKLAVVDDLHAFQSTLSVRRATAGPSADSKGLAISIHALREESDIEGVEARETHDISIHALREESDYRS